MIPRSERHVLHNNYIIGLFNNNHNIEENSNFENTKNTLLNNNSGLLLNKKIVKYSNPNNLNKNNSAKLKCNILLKEDDSSNIDKNIWFKYRLIMMKNMKEKKAIYNLELETDNNFTGNKNILSAYKDKGFYTIYKYKNVNKNYDKEIKAIIKWSIFSNHFKIFDSHNNILEEIIYNFNFKGWNEPTKLNIFIPFSNKIIKSGNLTDRNNISYIYKLENKSPEYNSIYKCYVLNFLNRKIIPNEKNLQIIYSDLKEDKNNILLQFAQVGNDEYILDYKFPFNSVTAFSLALTILSSRIFCQ